MGQSASLTAAAALLFSTPFQPEVGASRAPLQAPETGTTQEAREKEHRRDPPPRTPIAGIAGFDSLSKVRYASAPEAVHDLKVTCSFPERMRWMISTKIEGSLVRELSYLYGDAVYRIPTGTGASEACQGEERAEILRNMELRRALMLYPDGFTWKGEGVERTAELGDLGTLRARVPADAGGRPEAIECVDPGGKPIDAYRAVTWKMGAGRSWPATMELWRECERVWTETVESVDATARFVDSFFVPPDRREGSTSQPVGGAIRTQDVPPTCVLRTAIAAGTTWESALRELEELRASWSKRLGADPSILEAIATFEISEKGEPSASILRLTTIPADPPQGFVKEPGRKGLAAAIEGLVGVDERKIAELRRELPKGASAGRPYVRFDPKAGRPLRIVLVVPFDPGR